MVQEVTYSLTKSINQSNKIKQSIKHSITRSKIICYELLNEVHQSVVQEKIPNLKKCTKSLECISQNIQL